MTDTCKSQPTTGGRRKRVLLCCEFPARRTEARLADHMRTAREEKILKMEQAPSYLGRAQKVLPTSALSAISSYYDISC